MSGTGLIFKKMKDFQYGGEDIDRPIFGFLVA